MKIEKIRKKSSGLYEISFNNNTKISFYDDTIINYNLLTHKEISETQLKDIITFNNELDAYYKALKYINFKLRTKKEIQDKLKKNNFSSTIISKVINRLEKEKYLNDDLYIKAYINDQINLTLNGPMKIKSSLKKLGLSEKKVSNYIDNINNDIWNTKIQKIITKKVKNNHNLSKQRLVLKIKNDLINMGYNSDNIKSILAMQDIQNDKTIFLKEKEKELKKLSKKYEGKELYLKLKYNLYKKGFSTEDIDTINTDY